MCKQKYSKHFGFNSNNNQHCEMAEWLQTNRVDIKYSALEQLEPDSKKSYVELIESLESWNELLYDLI